MHLASELEQDRCIESLGEGVFSGGSRNGGHLEGERNVRVGCGQGKGQCNAPCSSFSIRPLPQVQRGGKAL